MAFAAARHPAHSLINARGVIPTAHSFATLPNSSSQALICSSGSSWYGHLSLILGMASLSAISTTAAATPGSRTQGGAMSSAPPSACLWTARFASAIPRPWQLRRTSMRLSNRLYHPSGSLVQLVSATARTWSVSIRDATCTIGRMATHILAHGTSLCGLPGVPADWPDGESWVAFIDEEALRRADCVPCLEILRESGNDAAGTLAIRKDRIAVLLGVDPSAISVDVARDGRHTAVEVRVDGKPLDVRQDLLVADYLASVFGASGVHVAGRA